MAKTLSTASEEYVKLVEEAVAENSNLQFIDFQVFNLVRAKNSMVKVMKANEIAELLSNREDLVIVGIYEKGFDRLDDERKRLLIEMALSQVSYDSEKEKVNIGAEPAINLTLGFYHKYHDTAVEVAELEQLTLQQIADEEKEEKERKKAEKASKKPFNN